MESCDQKCTITLVSRIRLDDTILVFLLMFKMNDRKYTLIYLTNIYENLLYAEHCSNY